MAARSISAKNKANSSDSNDHEQLSRRTRILNAAVDSFGTMGYYGTSLQKIANSVGLTKAGVLHYVGSKEGMLNLVLEEMYDRETDEINQRYLTTEHPHIPAMLRDVVMVNAKRPHLVHMFSTLSAEALNPDHPAHDYFVRREQRNVEQAMKTNWDVPSGIDAQDVISAAFAMMDGMQLRWLRNPEHEWPELWEHCENALFPLPLWQGYR